MIKDITEAIGIVRDTIDELNGDDMKAIVGELKELVHKSVNKLNSAEENKNFKSGNVQIIVGELKDAVQESLTKVNQEISKGMKDVDSCGPLIICFVLKDAACVNIYNGACDTWEPGDCRN